MKNQFILTALFITIQLSAQSSVDTIYSNNQKLAVNLETINEESISFKYPGETVLNMLYKNVVQKIIHKSGRVEIFNNRSSFKVVKSALDWEKVSITSIENEVRGLNKINEVSSKAVGTSIFSNMDQVKQRAHDKIKMKSAMYGANTVFLSEERSQMKTGDILIGGTKTNTTISGVAYSNKVLDYSIFTTLLGGKPEFALVKKAAFKNNSMELATFDYQNVPVEILTHYQEEGIIYVNIRIKGLKQDVFRVVYFDNSTITLLFEDSKYINNLILEVSK